jgi:hypothetical protein
MTKTVEVWFNVFRDDDGNLGTSCMHLSRAKAEKAAVLSLYRVGLNRVLLRAEFDKEPIPQEPGALVGKKVKLKHCDAVQVIFDRRVIDEDHHWPLVCVDKEGEIILSISFSDIEEVLED